MEDLNEALARARDGDREAIGVLYRAYAQPLLGFLVTQARRREDAEDLLGEVFLQAMRDLKGFEGDISGFRAWLYRIASNRAVDLARRNARRPEEALAAAEERWAESDPAADAVAQLERARLWDAVRALPGPQAHVVALRLAGGLTAAEIAQIVGKPVGAVKALQHRALVNLTKALRGAYPAEVGQRLETQEER